MKVLVTGFDPFGGEAVNPALEVVKRLDGCSVGGATVVALEIPTVRWKALEKLEAAIEKFDPALVVAVGQAGGRVDITLERVAINVDDYRIPDNEGNQPIDEAIAADGPAAYWSTLPVKSMVAAIRERGIPASVSNSAGTFLCNHVFYGLMHRLQQESKTRRGGFVHIPYLPEQAARLGGQPSMSLEMIQSGLEAALQAALTTSEDCKAVEGAIS